MVWEVQLSSASIADVAERTRRYVDDGLEVCWVTTRSKAPWMVTVPSIMIAPGKERGWVVRDGHRQLAAPQRARANRARRNAGLR